MCKILFFNNLFYPDSYGGAEKTMKIIVDGLYSKGYSVAVAALRPHITNMEVEKREYTIYRIPIINVDYELFTEKMPRHSRIVWKIKDVYNPDQIKFVKHVINKERPDIIFCHNLAGWSSSLWATINEYKIPIIQVVHDLYILCPRCMFNKGKSCKSQCMSSRILRLPYKHFSQKISAVVSISKYIEDTITKNGYFQSSIKKVIYNTRIIPSLEATRKSINAFGFIGNVMPHKGIEILLDAYHMSTIPVPLYVAGKCEERYKHLLLEKINSDERIKFLGYIDSSSFYKEIDVAVIPSLWDEPLGMVAVEALASNIPVISTGAGGLSEIVKNEENGLIFKPYNAECLRVCLEKMYFDNELFQKLQVGARKSVETFLNPNRQIWEYDDLIRKLVM